MLVRDKLTWEDVCSDPSLRDLPFKIELNRRRPGPGKGERNTWSRVASPPWIKALATSAGI
jgi:hypothetical protein